MFFELKAARPHRQAGAGKAIQSAVDTGVNLTKYTELLQALTAELSIAKDHATGSAEKSLTESYESAATSYRDALVLWRLKVEGRSDSILVFETLDKLLAPYTTIKIEKIEPGLRRISADSAMQAIWKVASSKLDAANAVATGH